MENAQDNTSTSEQAPSLSKELSGAAALTSMIASSSIQDTTFQSFASTHAPHVDPIVSGAKYLMQNRESGKLLVLVYGDVELHTVSDGTTGTLWRFIERDGWLEIRNTASGGWLCIEDLRSICIEDETLDHNQFIARAHPAGGYELLVPDNGLVLRRVDPLAFCLNIVAGSHEGLLDSLGFHHGRMRGLENQVGKWVGFERAHSEIRRNHEECSRNQPWARFDRNVEGAQQ
ncbi:hypothetical protein HJFPF1_08139 [Paramyrothecium foliicola]|nr:hypothetical protein HJFPF1_08139 [Paramyrothecium foliicola]